MRDGTDRFRFGEKRCYKCGEWLPHDAEHFYRNASKEDGLSDDCKICRNEQTRRYYKENPDKVNVLQNARRRRRGAVPIERHRIRIRDGKAFCKHCQSWKPLDEMCKNKRTKSGIQAKCYECHRRKYKK